MDTVAALAPMRRSSIGFDHFFSVLDRTVKSQHQADYPPYNIEKTGEDAYRLTLAIAGWRPAEIMVTAAPRLLVVAGRKTADGKRYLYRGIRSDSFEHHFDLADAVRVRGAQMADGLLTIDLVRAVPEAPAPRRIAITEAKHRAQPRGGPELKLVRSPAPGAAQQRGAA